MRARPGWWTMPRWCGGFNDAIRAKYGLQARLYALFALFSHRVRNRVILEVQLPP